MLARRLALVASSAAVLFALTGCPADEGSKPVKPAAADGEGDAGGDAPAPPPPPKPFDRASAKTPWKDTKVGDWAVYKMHSANKTMRFEVTKVDGNAITFTIKDAESGAQINEPTVDLEEEESRYKDPMTYDALARDKDGNEIKPYTESVEIKGKQLEALVVKRDDGRGSTTELWMCEKEVPPFNQCAIKSIRNGKLEVELIDFGRGS